MNNVNLGMFAKKYTNSYIREFAIDGMGIYDQLVSAVQTRGNVEKVIYSTNPFEYAVKCATSDEEIYYNSNSTVLTGEEEQFVFGSADFSR